MVVLQAEACSIARVFGGRVVLDNYCSGPASYDGLGARFVYVPRLNGRYRYAMDVEPRCLAAPSALAQVLGRQPLLRWTELEVAAKLRNISVHFLIRDLKMGSRCLPVLLSGLEIERCDTLSHWIAVGRRLSTPEQ
jgi:hypothetical protein